jgi:hypothetical protein
VNASSADDGYYNIVAWTPLAATDVQVTYNVTFPLDTTVEADPTVIVRATASSVTTIDAYDGYTFYFVRNGAGIEREDGADTYLVLEVSDSTLRYDRDFKAPFYARHGIPEAWVVVVGHNLLLHYDQPVDGVYRNQSSERANVVALPGLPGTSIDLSAIWA